jgi:RHS repeat-associated protein
VRGAVALALATASIALPGTSPAQTGGPGGKPLDNPVTANQVLQTKLGLERYYHYEGEDLGAGVQQLVNVANGNSLLRWTPFESAGRGLSTVVDLTYNSLEEHSTSQVGSNFSLSMSGLTRFGMPIDIHPNKADEIAGRSNKFIEIVDGDGTTHRFTQNAAGGWDEPAGVHLYLRKYSDSDPKRKWAFTRPDRTTFFYDADGYPTGVEDANGNRLEYTLEDAPPGDDPDGPKRRITTVTDAAGAGSSPAPNRSYRLSYYSKADARNAHVRGKVKRITDHSGSALDFEYYDDGNLLRIIQRGGTKADGTALPDRSIVFTYTTSNGAGPAIPAAGQRATPNPKTPNQSTRLYSVRDPRGNETRFAYLGPSAGQDRWKLASRVDRSGQTTGFGYDNTKRVTTVTQPLGRVSRYAYDTDGSVTKLTNPLGQEVTLTWSADRHVTKVVEPTGRSTEFAYNANGYLTDSWDQLRNRTQLEYEDLPVDAGDVASRWKAGRSIGHVSQLKRKTEPNGTATASPTDDFQWVFDYDSKGNPTKVTDAQGNATTYSYNGDGTLASSTDANDHTTSYPSYDANGLPTEIKDAKNQATRFSYDVDGLLRWVQDPLHQGDTGANGREYRIQFDYDSFHRMGRQSAPKSTREDRGNLIWSAADFDANDNLVKQIGPHYGATYTGGGAVETTTYDAMDRPLLVTGPDKSADPAGERTAFAYDAAGRTTRVTQPKGVRTGSTDKDFATFFDYDPLDRVTRSTRYEVNGSGNVTKTETAHRCYDLAGDLRSVTAPRAERASIDCGSTTTPFTTRFEYDAAHRPTTQVDPVGHRESATYDANGNVKSQTDPNGTTTTNAFDEMDRPTKVVQPFDDGDDPRDLTTKVEYDAVGNVKRVISPRAWDASSDKQTFDDYVETRHYDELDRLVKVDLPNDGSSKQQYAHRAYDPNGNLTMVSLPTEEPDPGQLGAKERTTRDYWDPGWIRISNEPGTKRVVFDYTAEGWQRSRTPDGDPARRALVDYYADGLPKQETGADQQQAKYEYDPDGNLTVAHDVSGATKDKEKAIDVAAAYDGFDRPSRTKYRSEGASDWRFSSLSYDLDGNVIARVGDGRETNTGTVTDDGRRQQFAYDDADWLRQQLDFGKKAGASDDRRLTNDFFPTGWEKERIIQKSDGSGGWETKKTTNWNYFLNGKLKTLVTKNGSGTTLESHRVAYVANGIYVNGNRTKDEFILRGPNVDAPCRDGMCTTEYLYDPRDRLVEERRTRAGTTNSTTYTLDPAGNVRHEVRPDRTISSSFDGNQMTSQTVTVGGASATSKFWYDTYGNLDCVTTEAGTKDTCPAPPGSANPPTLIADYSYDALNRLTSYRSWNEDGTPAMESEYVYDALDRPVSETERHGTQSPRTTVMTYLGLGDDVSEEQHKNSDGSLRTTKSYSYDAFGHRIAMTDKRKNTATGQDQEKDYLYGEDVLGSVSLLIDDAGDAKASYGYTPYGDEDAELTQEKGPKPDETSKEINTTREEPLNPYRFSGKRFDSGSGTLDMGARRFAPDTGRFIQQDQYDDALDDLDLSTDPLTQNRYSLAGGNPISFVETDGHLIDGGGFAGSARSPRPRRRRTPRGGGSAGVGVAAGLAIGSNLRPRSGRTPARARAGEDQADHSLRSLPALGVLGGSYAGRQDKNMPRRYADVSSTRRRPRDGSEEGGAGGNGGDTGGCKTYVADPETGTACDDLPDRERRRNVIGGSLLAGGGVLLTGATAVGLVACAPTPAIFECLHVGAITAPIGAGAAGLGGYRIHQGLTGRRHPGRRALEGLDDPCIDTGRCDT